ncbi:hypothetical protein [Streptomyces sp. NPDC002587]
MPRKPSTPGSSTPGSGIPGVSAVEPAVAPLPRPDEPPRLTLPLVTGVISFPVLGTVLAVTGMPSSEIYPLLAYCGGIGAAVLIAASGGRKLITGLAELVLRVSQ